jgi:hypothetical protein
MSSERVPQPAPSSGRSGLVKSAIGLPKVYICFDLENDGELCEVLRSDSNAPGSAFSVCGTSERSSRRDGGEDEVRRRIGEADQVIVICGEHTGASAQAGEELRIAKEERTPYFLLWGRPKLMCTKPAGARSDDGMYGWSPQVLRDQIAINARRGKKPPA